MPRVTINSTNFTAGEVSPKCYGRVDLSRYQNGAKAMPNCIVNIHGGAERRDGSIFVYETKDSSKRSILIPYVFSTTQAYMLEFGHLYMRVYLQSGGLVLVGGLPYEIVTPYTEAMLDDLDYTQGADTMFLFHQSVAPQILQRFQSDAWVIRDAPFTVMPFDEIGHTFPVVATLSAATVGAGRTLTAASPIFLSGDNKRHIAYGSGTATVTAYISATQLTVTVDTAFSTVTLPASQWELLGTVEVNLTPGSTLAGLITTLFIPALQGFRAEDVGKHIRINGGLVQITTYIDPSNAEGLIKSDLSSVATAGNGSWTMESSVWNPLFGYPRCGSLYEQRLCAAGTIRNPQSIWGSRSGLVYDFTLGINDDDAFSFTLASTGQINPIQRMSSTSTLLPMTYGGEYTMEGGNDYALTPTNVKARSPSVYGSNTVKPMRIGNEILFVQRAGRKIRSMAYRIESDTYNAPDLTVLAEHITVSGIRDIAYQQEPRSLLWCVRNDGKMATLTLDRDEGVTAWTPQQTDGLYESISSIPNGTGDEVWTIVNRTIGASTKRYVERFDPTRFMDSGITGTSGPGAALWSGLDHLEGKQVAVKADGVYMGLYTVVSGDITLPRDALAVEIGLPFSNYVTLLRPEVQAGDGTAQGNASRVHEVSVLVMETIGMKINGDEVAFREFGTELLDEAPAEFSGFKRGGLTAWVRGDEQEITISQDEPYPFHLLSVVRKFTVNS